MTEQRPPIVRLPVSIGNAEPPPPLAERRGGGRRASDRRSNDEAIFLSRTLAILGTDDTPAGHLASLLRLLSQTVGARRGAVLTELPDRRVAVVADAPEDRSAADSLATWLDAQAPRTPAERAAAGPAPIVRVGDTDDLARASGIGDGAAASSLGILDDGPEQDVPEPYRAEPDDLAPPTTLPTAAVDTRFAFVEVEGRGGLVLGFEMADADGVALLADRLSANLARQSALALSLVTSELAQASELSTLRANEAERERFVAAVAHDLRTPLTGLSGYLDLVLDGKVADPAVEREFLERSRRIVASMGELVGDLLDISRLDSGNLQLEIAPFSVADIARRVIATLAPLALERGIELDASLPSRIRSATGDRRHVERILTNLIGNALKFTPAGGRVEVVGRLDGPVALVAICDNGSGVADDEHELIFQRFYRSSGQREIIGTGLGLAIARDLARAMGGDLAIASVAGAGSSFILGLPGPAPIEGDVVTDALARAVGVEGARLEQAAVLDALRDAGRGSTHPARQRQSGRPTHLHAIDSSRADSDIPDPA